MPDPSLYSFLPPWLDKPVHGLLETGQSIRTSRVRSLEESRIAQTLFGDGTGYFITTPSGSRYTLIVLPVSALTTWLAGFLGVSKRPKEALINE